MSTIDGKPPAVEAAKSPEGSRSDREIVADVIDGSIVIKEDFAKAMADLAMHDLGIAPNKHYFTIHDVRQVAEATARTTIRIARALVGPPDDLEELERRIANNGNGGEG